MLTSRCIGKRTSYNSLTTKLVHGTIEKLVLQFSVTFPRGKLPFLDMNINIRPSSTARTEIRMNVIRRKYVIK